ncbi:MAG: hypothetical protein ACE5H3_02915, partial [Planctomycetota bacterium]
FEPFLRASAHTLAARRGARVDLGLAFPPAEAGLPYLLLGSLAGKGPTDLLGLPVPLTTDALFKKTLRRRFPRFWSGAQGTLDAQATGQASLQGAPGLSRVIGTTLFLAAITLDSTGSPRLTSAATTVTTAP